MTSSTPKWCSPELPAAKGTNAQWWQLELHQLGALGHLVAGGAAHGPHDTVVRRHQRVFHLHGFEEQQRLIALDLVARAGRRLPGGRSGEGAPVANAKITGAITKSLIDALLQDVGCAFVTLYLTSTAANGSRRLRHREGDGACGSAYNGRVVDRGSL